MKNFLAFAILMVPLAGFGQSAGMLSMARDELAKRGLEEAEVRTRLLENGIDGDNIPPTEYAAYRNRVLRVINTMQAEKEAANLTPAAAATGGAEVVVTAEDIPLTTTGEAAAEAALEEAIEEAYVLPTAGNNI